MLSMKQAWSASQGRGRPTLPGRLKTNNLEACGPEGVFHILFPVLRVRKSFVLDFPNAAGSDRI